MANNADENLMTVEEAAEYLRYSVGTVYNKVGRKELPCVRIGRSLRFRRADLDAAMRSDSPPSA